MGSNDSGNKTLDGSVLSQCTACNGQRLAMEGSAIKRGAAKNGWLSNGWLGDGQLCNKALDSSTIKRWMDSTLMDDGQ